MAVDHYSFLLLLASMTLTVFKFAVDFVCELDLNLILRLVRSTHPVETLRNVYCDVV